MRSTRASHRSRGSGPMTSTTRSSRSSRSPKVPPAAAAELRVTFVRTVGAKDRVYVAREDGSETSWDFASYGDELPHDLVHLIVESRFGVHGGIWGRVAAGADLGLINAIANRVGGRDKYRELGDDLDEVYLAETLANAPWTRAETAADVSAQLPDIDIATIEAVRAELLALRDRWRALVPKGAI